jgi:hypothetical protein
MIHSNPLLRCHSLNLLDAFIGDVENCRPIIGPWGGRKYSTVLQKPLFNFSLNDLVSQLLNLAEKPAEEAQTLRNIIQKIRILDAKADPHVSILRRILTAVRRFFGNFFFNRQALLKELEQKIPAPQQMQQQPEKPYAPLQPTLPIQPLKEPIVKPIEPIVPPIEPIVKPASQRRFVPPAMKFQTLDNWLINPIEGPKTTAFFMNIKEVLASPYSKANETIEGLFKQCTEDQTIDLQTPYSLRLIEGVFSHCIVDKIITKYSSTKSIDIFEWLSRQPTLNHQSLDAALKGHLAHKNPSFSSLYELVKCIQTLRMEKTPTSLGRALAKMVQLDANANPFEQLFKNLLQAGHIQETDYKLILDEFRIKRADPSKAGCTWKILDWLQEHAKKEGWR